MPFEREKQSYDRDGFVVVRRFLTEKDLAELQSNLERYMRDVVPALSDTEAFYEDRERPETLKQLQRMDCDSFFQEYEQHPRWRELAQVLVGEAIGSAKPEWFNKPPGTNHVTPPHQDNFYFCLTPARVVTIWMALDEVDTETGCLRYVTGSHLRGLRSHTASGILGFSQGITDYMPDDFTREVAIPLQPGDVVAHHGMTIHRADANISANRHRRSFAMVCKGVSCRRNEVQFSQYLESARDQHRELGLKT